MSGWVIPSLTVAERPLCNGDCPPALALLRGGQRPAANAASGEVRVVSRYR